jgi:methylenetetrahydrofolate dehydrogenase (NADP+) / methenyltetrahydrofolate cyclohydrolase
MNLIDGRAIVEEEVAALGEQVQQLKASGAAPTLAIIAVGDDPASASYRRGIVKLFDRLEIAVRLQELPESATTDDVVKAVSADADDAGVHGILVQTPLPDQVDLTQVATAIPYEKDIDGLNPLTLGRLASSLSSHVPATAAAVMRMIAETGVPLKGKNAVVIGRSVNVGKPAAMLLLAEHATVTICHSRTQDMPAIARQADVLVVAIGKARFVTGDYVGDGAIVIDVGINMDDGKLVGDVDATSVGHAGHLTPVPGGVGPVTNAMLAGNLLRAATGQV